MALASGIGGRAHPRRDQRRSGLAKAREEVAVLDLRKMRQLVEADEVEFGALVVEAVVLMLEVTEFDDCPARERPAVLRLVPGGLARPPFLRAIDQPPCLRELREGLAEDDRLVAGQVRVLSGGP